MAEAVGAEGEMPWRRRSWVRRRFSVNNRKFSLSKLATFVITIKSQIG